MPIPGRFDLNWASGSNRLSDNENFPIIWVPIFIPDGALVSETFRAIRTAIARPKVPTHGHLAEVAIRLSFCQGVFHTTKTHTGNRSRADCERISQIASASPLQLKRQHLSGEQPAAASKHFYLADLLLRLSGGGGTRRRRH
jgi:hypothetical protein